MLGGWRLHSLGTVYIDAGQYTDAVSAQEARLSMLRRRGVSDSECNILVVQGNLANTYAELGRLEEALSMRRDVYSGTLKLFGGDNASHRSHQLRLCLH